MVPSSFRAPSPGTAVYGCTGCALHNLGALVADYLVDDTPGTVQCCSPSDSPKASCLMGEMLRLEIRVFRSPRAKKWGDQI